MWIAYYTFNGNWFIEQDSDCTNLQYACSECSWLVPGTVSVDGEASG